MNYVSKERFFSIMTGFITHLTRQQNVIAEMQTMCLRVINRWLSTEKVISWFKIHRPQLLAHIKSKQPASTPPHLWWVTLLSMHHSTIRAAVIFRSIQGLTTRVLQQRNALDNLIASFNDDIGVTGPFTVELIANIDPSTHVISGRYVVVLSSVREFLIGWLLGLTPYLTKLMIATRITFNTISPLFTSPPVIGFRKFLPIEIETTMRWPIPVLFPQCYRMSSLSYPQPTSSERFGNMLSDWSIVTHQLRSISSLTSTKP